MMDGIKKLLNEKKAVIIQSFPNEKLLDLIQQHVVNMTRKGHHVLVLSSQANHEPHKTKYNVFLQHAFVMDNFLQGFGYQCDIHQFMEMFKSNRYDAWLSKLKLIIIDGGEHIFYDPTLWETASYLLQDKLIELNCKKFPHLLILIEPRRSCESALKECIPLYETNFIGQNETDIWNETTFLLDKDHIEQHWWTIWSSEQSRDYLNQFDPNHHSKSVGIIAPLAQFAGKHQIDKQQNLAFITSNSGEVDRLENLVELEGQILYQLENELSWQTFQNIRNFQGCVSVYSQHGNPWVKLRKLATMFPKASLFNVVAHNNMLLDYVLANAYCFASVPLQAFAPKIRRNSGYNTILTLLHRLQLMGELALSTIQYALTGIQYSDDLEHSQLQRLDLMDCFSTFQQLVAEYFSPYIAQQLRLERRMQWSAEQKQYIAQSYVQLYNEQLNLSIDWLQTVQVSDGHNHFTTLLKDHVFQQYWKGKLVGFCGKLFEVEQIDMVNRSIKIIHCNNKSLIDYRVQKQIRIHQPSPQWKVIKRLSHQQTYGLTQVSIECLSLDFSVQSGYIVSSPSHWKTPPILQAGEQQNNIRHYVHGRALKIQLLNEQGESVLSDAMVTAFSAWLNEVAITLFPEVYPFFISAAELQTGQLARPQQRIIQYCVPELIMPENHQAKSAIWVFEDSQTDLGIISSVLEHYLYLFDLCYDWLKWYSQEQETSIQLLDRVCLHNMLKNTKHWFSYGLDELDPCFDFDGLKQCLEQVFVPYQVFDLSERRERVQQQVEKYCYLQG